MWTPETPVVVAGYTLSRDEAWLREFTQEWFRLAEGKTEMESIADWGIELLVTQGDQDPCVVARAAWCGAG